MPAPANANPISSAVGTSKIVQTECTRSIASMITMKATA